MKNRQEVLDLISISVRTNVQKYGLKNVTFLAMHGKNKYTAWRRDGVRGKRLGKRLLTKYERREMKKVIKKIKEEHYSD